MHVVFKGQILIVNFKGNRNKMNMILNPISDKYEGTIINREGHNFTSNLIPDEGHELSKFKLKCKYVIGIYNLNSLRHELMHAKFALDDGYRKKILYEWYNLPKETRTRITIFLKKIGYRDNVIIDEYQAYRYTEAKNFFGIKLE
jgi:hypothetical protein